MIRFQCPGCSTGLRVAFARAGKLTRCPTCGRTVRAPARPPGEVEIVEELPVVEDDDEDVPEGEEISEGEEVESAEDVEEEEREEEERPRRRRHRRDDEDEDDDAPVIRSRHAPPTEEERDEEGRREVITWNRIMGVVGVVFGVGFTSGAITCKLTGVADFLNPLNTPYSAAGCGSLLLGLALMGVGAFYVYRG